jgi:hypothetical protein
MTRGPLRRCMYGLIAAAVLGLGVAPGVTTRAAGGPGIGQAQPSFGGTYSSLDARRKKLVNDWTIRVSKVLGQTYEPERVYDTYVSLSAKTTFEAVTNALMTTPLTDDSGQRFGDALDIIESVESVRGQVAGASGDHQFRIYVTLKPDAVQMLERSREFKRIADNTVYHKGYPINFRQQGGPPSMQVSIAPNRHNADVDVDYRASSFPVAMFNGHLTSSNSDVRAGNNYDRHANRWTGFQNWWRSIFGIRVRNAPEPADKDVPGRVAGAPRAGKKPIDAMVNDFLTAWLVDGDILGAMSYFTDRSFACVAEDADDAATADKGMLPFILIRNLKLAHETMGPRKSLEGTTVGVRLSKPALRVVTQPHHAQFVVYSVPDDVAAKFDCESRLAMGATKRASRVYGNYYGATFYLESPAGKTVSLALLWARDNGYWKIASWQTEPDVEDTPAPMEAASAPVARAKADPGLALAAKDFLESWLVRKDTDAAFKYLSARTYACYDLTRQEGTPAAGSPEAAAKLIRAGLARAASDLRKGRLEDLIEAVPPFHPAVRLLDHPNSRAFVLTQVPNAIAAVADCAARAAGAKVTGDVPLEYGEVFGMNLRMRSRGGETPVLRMLWIKENGAWRIAAYDVEFP